MEGSSHMHPERASPQPAIEKAKKFLSGFAGKSPREKIQTLAVYQPQQYIRSINGNIDTIPYLVSGSPESAQNKPTVVLFPGIFQDAVEKSLDIATIAHVFNAHVVVIDYASLAAKGGMKDGIIKSLPELLESTESGGANPPQRIFIGESLGGFVAQTLALACEKDKNFAARLNIQHLILSHTIPPQLIDRRVELFMRFIRLFGPYVPMPLARVAINGFSRRALGKIVNSETDATLLDREWITVDDILQKERFLTGRRGFGYTRSAVGSVDESRKYSTQTKIPTDIIFSKTDKVFKSIPLETWRKYHAHATITELNGIHGHFNAGLKETVLAEQLIPIIAKTLPVAP